VGEAQALIERCESLIERVDLPEPFDLSVLCDRLGRLWNSTVVLYPTETAPGQPCGMWLSLQIGSQAYDVFAYEKNATPWHQAQMIFHEIGHRLASHVGAAELPLDTRELLASLMPNLNTDLVSRSLGCTREPTAYTDPKELEAEYIGARLLDRAFGWRAGPLAPDTPIGVQRLHFALESTYTRGHDDH
jgi:hypothetical protein